MIVTTYRIGRSAAQNFWRNFWLSIITVSMLSLTLLSVNVLVILNMITERAIDVVEERIEVSVVFNGEAPEERVTGAASFLRDLPQVRSVEVITPDEALEDFRARHEDDPAVIASLDEVGENPFGPGLVVKAFSAGDYPFILDSLQNPQFRDDIRETSTKDYEAVIEGIRTTTSRVRAFGLALSGVFLLIAVLIVFNTVRIGIFIHKEEIGIMKLVGATNWFVRAPFLLESILYSALATLLAAAVTLPAVATLDPRFAPYFGAETTGLLEYFQVHALEIFGLQFLILALISFVATGIAMRRYLKV